MSLKGSGGGGGSTVTLGMSIWAMQIMLPGSRSPVAEIDLKPSILSADIHHQDHQLVVGLSLGASIANNDSLQGCPFFNDKMKDDSGLGAIYKRKSCPGDSATCARHMVFEKLVKQNIPATLYPNMYSQAQKLKGASVSFHE